MGYRCIYYTCIHIISYIYIHSQWYCFWVCLKIGLGAYPEIATWSIGSAGTQCSDLQDVPGPIIPRFGCINIRKCQEFWCSEYHGFWLIAILESDRRYMQTYIYILWIEKAMAQISFSAKQWTVFWRKNVANFGPKRYPSSEQCPNELNFLMIFQWVDLRQAICFGFCHPNSGVLQLSFNSKLPSGSHGNGILYTLDFP